MTQEPAQSQSLPTGHRCSIRPRYGAFNLMEMLVVLALVGLMAALSYTSLSQQIPRQKLRGKANEVSGFFQKARLSAIKEGRDVAVQVETYDSGEWLVAYRQDDLGATKELARVEVGNPSRPYDAHLAGVAGESAGAEVANTFKDLTLIYKSTGTAATVGALRLSIGTAGRENTIEVAIQNIGGQPAIRKYIRSVDRPAGLTDTKFFAETHYGTDWDWTWY